MKTIFDPSFRYTASFNTDVKKTFARIRRDRRADMQKATPASLASVTSIAGQGDPPNRPPRDAIAMTRRWPQ